MNHIDLAATLRNNLQSLSNQTMQSQGKLFAGQRVNSAMNHDDLVSSISIQTRINRGQTDQVSISQEGLDKLRQSQSTNNLTLNNTSEEDAIMMALQTKQALHIKSLPLAGQSTPNSILDLFK